MNQPARYSIPDRPHGQGSLYWTPCITIWPSLIYTLSMYYVGPAFQHWSRPEGRGTIGIHYAKRYSTSAAWFSVTTRFSTRIYARSIYT